MSAVLQIVSASAAGLRAVAAATPAGTSATPCTAMRCRWNVTAAITLHVALLLAASRVVLPRLPQAVPEQGFAMIFTATPSTIPTAAPPAIAHQIAPVPSAAPRPVLPPVGPVAAAPPVRLHRVQKPRRPSTPPVQAEIAPPAPRLPAPFPAVQTDLSPPASREMAHDLLAALQVKIRAAVQAAMIYPASARMLHRQGRVQVGFTFADGAVSNVAVAVSSGTQLLDAAALAAVRRAAMPRAPAGLGGRALPILVWVAFSLAGQA